MAKDGLSATSYHTVVFHHQPYLGALMMYWMVRRFGKEAQNKRFASKNIQLCFWDALPFTPDGRSASEWDAAGYLLLQVGGSRFSDAGILLEEMDLPIRTCDQISDIVVYTTSDTSKGGNSPFSLKALVKAMYVNEVSYEVLLTTVFTLLDAKRRQQQLFRETCQQFRKVDWKGYKVTDVSGRERTILVIHSDNPEAAVAVGFCDKEIEVIVQVKSTGHVYLKARVAFNDICRAIRTEEAVLHDASPLTLDELNQEGVLRQQLEWCKMSNYQALGNLCERSHVAPTKIPLKRIVEIIKNRLAVHQSPAKTPPPQPIPTPNTAVEA